MFSSEIMSETPLTLAQLQELAKVKVIDVKRAIVQSNFYYMMNPL